MSDSNQLIRERFREKWGEHGVLQKIKDVAQDPVNATFWDVGACIGVHSIFAARHFENVVAFEPVSQNVTTLADNIIEHREQDTITVVSEALSNKTGVTNIEVRESLNPGHGRHSMPSDGDYDKILTQSVLTRTGDFIADRGHIPNVVKIDVEGAEGLVLDGMESTLAERGCRHVFMETHEPNPDQPSYKDFGYTLDEIYQALLDAGFTIERLNKEYLIWAHK